MRAELTRGHGVSGGAPWASHFVAVDDVVRALDRGFK